MRTDPSAMMGAAMGVFNSMQRHAAGRQGAGVLLG